MSNVLDSPWRGCAAYYRHTVNEDHAQAAQFLTETVYYINCDVLTPPLPDIEYRSNNAESDILRHVFRWDDTPFEVVFRNGFEAICQQDTPDDVFFNLDHYVHEAGRPLDSRRPATHAFISTTLDSGWHPRLNPGTQRQVYRYEIYAPGGIWVAQTLGNRYRHGAQDEVIFVAGIAPQYIRSAQLFTLTGTTAGTSRQRVNNELIENWNFNPDPSRLLNIQNPVSYCYDQDPNGSRRSRVDLTINTYQPSATSSVREKRQVSTNRNSDTTNWYAGAVANLESYINAAFRSSRPNEAYLFMKNEYVLLNYAPGTTNDKVLFGPRFICDGYPSLAGTAFAEHAIDCAFGSYNRDEAFIFSGNLCAQINYAPHTPNDKIIKGPMTITAMFPFFKDTVFKNGVDAAFEAMTRYGYEAYLFKDNQYAHINYDSNYLLNPIRIITQGFPSLKNTMFESGIDAAFASHRTNEAYLFKKDYYALINFAPRTTNDYISVKKISDHWPSLRNILPRKNHGLDVHDHTKPAADRDHDEL
ncbi:hypothetical protein HYC85_029910 [Camellia sinensis]|uniref:Pierisin-like domain-containing protein n=1 Tax=Camellia sinensis TaxID=4442 RepID=A0A7J7FZF2_CAMSI|nr:hypothetical protein HYC85_029910 [Camellia sinensis]